MAHSVRVKGHIRKDGTYVPPHYRTSPDKSKLNNYSFPGNFNPNTLEFTPGDPLKALMPKIPKLPKLKKIGRIKRPKRRI